MTRLKLLAALGVFFAPLALASAEEAVNPAASAPPSAEEASLRGFGLQNAQCVEWSDSCAICLRDEKDAAHCSTPGIACQPAAIACRREKAK